MRTVSLWQTSVLREMFLATAFLKHKPSHTHICREGGGGNKQKALIDYLVTDERIRKEVLEVEVVGGMLNLDHNVVIAKVRINTR